MRTDKVYEIFSFGFTLPLRFRLPLEWEDFNREAKRYAKKLEKKRKSNKSIDQLWRNSGQDIQKFLQVAEGYEGD